jgi:hypothetical protein
MLSLLQLYELVVMWCNTSSECWIYSVIWICCFVLCWFYSYFNVLQLHKLFVTQCGSFIDWWMYRNNFNWLWYYVVVLMSVLYTVAMCIFCYVLWRFSCMLYILQWYKQLLCNMVVFLIVKCTAVIQVGCDEIWFFSVRQIYCIDINWLLWIIVVLLTVEYILVL